MNYKRVLIAVDDGRDENVQAFVEEGKPYEMILSASGQWEADLIVMGTHGRTGLSYILLGSVAEKVLRHSEKPLLVVPVKVKSL